MHLDFFRCPPEDLESVGKREVFIIFNRSREQYNGIDLVCFWNITDDLVVLICSILKGVSYLSKFIGFVGQLKEKCKRKSLHNPKTMKNEKPQFKNSTKKRKTQSTLINRSLDMREIRRCTDIPGDNAARERSRVKSLRAAFADLQRALPCVPPDTKLSKLDVLVLGKVTYLFINILTKSCCTFQKCRRKLGKRKRKKRFHK